MWNDWPDFSLTEGLISPDDQCYTAWDDDQSNQTDTFPIPSSEAEKPAFPAERSDIIPPQVFPVPLFTVPNPLAFPPNLIFAGFPGFLTGIQPRWKPRKPNKVRKGDGPESVPDPEGYDDYEYQKSPFFRKLKPLIKKRHSRILKLLCKAIRQHQPEGLSIPNRWAMRRVPCSYAWLDRNQTVISDDLLMTCLMELRQNGDL
jgi:hypothetical protein